MKKIAIVQSNYIPWKGYFDLIAMVDEFVLFDDMQYTRRDWRNRNRIKTPEGLRWLTIPIAVSGRRRQRIRDARVSDPRWAARHWDSLRRSYGRADWFGSCAPAFQDLYSQTFTHLSDVNRAFIGTVCTLLGIPTTLSSSADYQLGEGRTERLVALCAQAGASEYVSGPSAREYLDEPLFEAAGIGVTYLDYSNYPQYQQLHGAFEHAVSIVDLIFNVGPAATRFMKTFPPTMLDRPGLEVALRGD